MVMELPDVLRKMSDATARMRHGTARKLICDRSDELLIPDMKTSLPILVALMLLPHGTYVFSNSFLAHN